MYNLTCVSVDNLKNEISLLELSIKTVSNEINKITEEIESISNVMSELYRELTIEADTLVIKLKQVKNELLSVDPLYSIENESKEATKQQKCGTIEEVKDLFREISKLCHPDITNDNRLNDIFIQASIAHNNNDYLTLSNLRNLIDRDTPIETVNNEEILIKKLNILKKDLKLKVIELERKKKHILYKISLKYKSNKISDKLMGRKWFMENAYSRIVKLAEEIEKIEEKLNEKINL